MINSPYNRDKFLNIRATFVILLLIKQISEYPNISNISRQLSSSTAQFFSSLTISSAVHFCKAVHVQFSESVCQLCICCGGPFVFPDLQHLEGFLRRPRILNVVCNNSIQPCRGQSQFKTNGIPGTGYVHRQIVQHVVSRNSVRILRL